MSVPGQDGPMQQALQRIHQAVCPERGWDPDEAAARVEALAAEVKAMRLLESELRWALRQRGPGVEDLRCRLDCLERSVLALVVKEQEQLRVCAHGFVFEGQFCLDCETERGGSVGQNERSARIVLPFWLTPRPVPAGRA